MIRFVLRTIVLTGVFLAVMAPATLASEGHDGGEGLWGETNDKVITNAGFIIIAAVPTFLLIMSLIQWRLDKRKDRRLAAAKARKARSDLRGGW
jgi:hypothetical protein